MIITYILNALFSTITKQIWAKLGTSKEKNQIRCGNYLPQVKNPNLTLLTLLEN